MPSVLGLPRLKNHSHKIIACRLQKGFRPKAGQAVSAIKLENNLYNLVIPFNGDFFGIACEVREKPELVTVIRAGLSLAVKKDPNATISPVDKTYFTLNAGVLTGSDGAAVGGQIEKLSESVFEPETGEQLSDSYGALITITTASRFTSQDPLNDFNQQDFLAGDFA